MVVYGRPPLEQIVLGCALIIAGLICNLIIVVDAFQTEGSRGCLTLLNVWWFFSYAIDEFEHDWKWLIVPCALLGPVIGGVLLWPGSVSVP